MFEDVKASLAAAPEVVVDMRNREEVVQQGSIPGAKHVPCELRDPDS